MENPFRFVPVAVLLLLIMAWSPPLPCRAEPGPAPGKQERCPVCGMFVAKYSQWIAQIRLGGDATLYFDGVKDLMTCFLNPDSCGLASQDRIDEIWVQDYYTLDWIDGRQAFFVTGSDVYGPMGHEFIPFATKEAAAAFLADHHGQKVMNFESIDRPLVESMRVGGKMR
jgi:nitrous oxide reductase accessory protein NosL